MGDMNDFLEPEYGYQADLNGSFLGPLSYSYTPFSIEIPNTYSCLHHQHTPTPLMMSQHHEACPSVCGIDSSAFSCQLCCDSSSSHLSEFSSVCYSDSLLPQYSYEVPSHTTAPHAWTPRGAVPCYSADLCDAVTSMNSEDKQIFSTHVSRRQVDMQHTLCPVSSDVETAPHKDSMCSFSERSKKRCHCTKSQCLKLYCDCFANGELCSDCSCVNCFNNMEHATNRDQAIKTCLDRNPGGFRFKIRSSKQKGNHTRGCNCKSSGCLKNYCECYKGNIRCSSVCKCVGCSNDSRIEVKESAVETFLHPDNSSTHRRTNVSCITDAVVEATCGCLLAQGEEAQKDGLSQVQTERAVLQEFGQCLTQIVHFIFKNTHTQS
ncbi:spexin prohormone 2 isoform 1-T1 [Clarias gariepinus]